MKPRAQLYRMVTPDHICPFGLKSRDLLRRKGLPFDDHLLRSRSETDAFQLQHRVDTTPQTFIDGKRIGGYDDLRRYFGLNVSDPDKPTYAPVIAVYLIALLLVLANGYATMQGAPLSPVALNFVGMSMCLLALQKLRDVEAFTNQFITYDLLGMRRVRYAYLYPFAEAYLGLGMVAHLPAWAVAPIGTFLGGIGTISVVKAVYIEKRPLKCACVGGNSNVPLGFVSLIENLLMLGSAIWMLIQVSL